MTGTPFPPGVVLRSAHAPQRASGPVVVPVTSAGRPASAMGTGDPVASERPPTSGPVRWTRVPVRSRRRHARCDPKAPSLSSIALRRGGDRDGQSRCTPSTPRPGQDPKAETVPSAVSEESAPPSGARPKAVGGRWDGAPRSAAKVLRSSGHGTATPKRGPRRGGAHVEPDVPAAVPKDTTAGTGGSDPEGSRPGSLPARPEARRVSAPWCPEHPAGAERRSSSAETPEGGLVEARAASRCRKRQGPASGILRHPAPVRSLVAASGASRLRNGPEGPRRRLASPEGSAR